MKILVIEDDPEIVQTISLCFELRWPGASLISALGGRKGVELVKTDSPNIVILDLGLPDIDGFEVLRRIRSFSAVPVIILTVRGEEMDKVKGLEMGADDYIVKPFTPAEFLSRVKAAVRRSETPESQVDEKPIVMENLKIDFSAREVSIGDKPLKLPPDGYKLLLEVLAQKDSDKNEVEGDQYTFGERQTRRNKFALGEFPHHLKLLYQQSLDRTKHYLIIGKQKMFSFIHHS